MPNEMTNKVTISTTTTSTIASYLAGFSSFFAGLNFNDWLALAGFIVVFATYLTNLYFQSKRDNREAERHKAEMRAFHVSTKGQ